MIIRLEAIEITAVINGGVRGTLRLEAPDVIVREEEPAGPGRTRVRLVVEGRQVVIGPRYRGGQQRRA